MKRLFFLFLLGMFIFNAMLLMMAGFFTGSTASSNAEDVVTTYADRGIDRGSVPSMFFGWLMDMKWNHLIVNKVAIYSLRDFRTAMWIIPIGFVISLILAFLIKETHATQQAK